MDSIEKLMQVNAEPIKMLKRCTKCILPETFPFIEYDEKGECNYCKNYKPIELEPNQELIELANRIRNTDGKIDCIVMFSGGRDSSYLLHYVKRELKLNPIAFTYDWGMSTLVGDENAQNMCDILGVERIIVRPNIEKKIRNVRLNVNAWLRKPHLGLIPLFTAGDKHFFTAVNKLAKERGLKTIFIGTNPLEKTDFKTGFCGVKPNFNAKRIYNLTLSRKLKMILFYLKEFIKNPRYINASLLESMTAFFSFYSVKQEQIDIFKYIKWDEEEANKLLIEEYDWKLAEDTDTTWRIGDATAPFYNYIYCKVAGFTENDTFRSNQIREGVMKREEALEKVYKENLPRPKSTKWYFEKIGLDEKNAINIINQCKSLY